MNKAQLILALDTRAKERGFQMSNDALTVAADLAIERYEKLQLATAVALVSNLDLEHLETRYHD